MKKKLSLIVLVTLTLMLSLMPTFLVRLAHASIQSRIWGDTYYTGFDSFYGENVYAYRTGSTAILKITIENDYRRPVAPFDKAPINVSAVGVHFDWDDSYNSTEVSMDSPFTILEDDTWVFRVSFTVPSTDKATNLFLHGYTIFVEHVNATTGPKEIVDTWEDDTYLRLPDFAVYSEDQADAQDLGQVLDALPLPAFTSARANLLIYKAENETAYGDRLYIRGDFAEAKDHYGAALSKYNEAFVAEEEYGVKLEDLDITIAEAEVKYFESMGAAVAGLPIMFSLFGVSAVLFGIGYVIKQLGTLKKPVSREVTE